MDSFLVWIFVTLCENQQYMSIKLLQIPLKLYEHRGSYWRKKPPWTISEETFPVPVPRTTAASKIGNGVIPLLWQLRCHCNPDPNKFSSLSNTIVVGIFPNLCFHMASFRCYDNSDVMATLIITNFHNLIQLLWQVSKSLFMATQFMLRLGRYWPWKTVTSHLNRLQQYGRECRNET